MKDFEKIPYLKILMYIALADDHVDENELKYFEETGRLYGLNQEQIDELQSSVVNKNERIEDIVQGITERSTKLTLLYELLALCYVDNNYTAIEKDGMKKICRLLGIEIHKLIELESVMEKNLSLQMEINKILER